MNDKKSVSLLKVMLKLQDEVNTKININWRQARNPWYRAIWTECAELMDHIGWKWWKSQAPNIAQIHLELIDIWHFGLSAVLEKSKSIDEAVQTLSPLLRISNMASNGKFSMTLASVEDFANKTISEKTFLTEQYSALIAASGLSFHDIYVQYINKNVLNRFRQDNGYNSGAYVKIWAGKEDNEWLVEISSSLDANNETYAESLYQMLNEKYKSI